MKRLYMVVCLICVLILTGCSSQPEYLPEIRVYIQETAGCTIENNGQVIRSGEDAVFYLTFERGVSLAGTDYAGKSQTEVSNKTVKLTLEDVRYPTSVKLRLTRSYAQLTYHANGGYGLHTLEDSVTKTASLSVHTRPNTDTGTDLFARSGCTLVCWNTEPDGSGIRVGLGSRVSVPEGALDLYAQWAPWSDPSLFTWTGEETATITGYTGSESVVVIPEYLDGLEVTAIAPDAFVNCTAGTVVLPKSIDVLEPGAFRSCSLESLVLFDNIVTFGDDCFVDCGNLKTLYINAIEAPYGYLYRRESCYADKVDMLINAQGQNKLVFYGGCSMWFNLDGNAVLQALGDRYAIINMALNGTVNSLVQMQIMEHFLEPGDILFHTPEVSSSQQLLTFTDMLEGDGTLWCGIENNYDLFALVDLQSMEGEFDSLCYYLGIKSTRANYDQVYTDDQGQTYMDRTGSVAFYRNTTAKDLGDRVFLDPDRVSPEALANLATWYSRFQDRGVRIYVSYACINLDAVAEDQLGNAQAVEEAFAASVAAMDGPVLISRMEEFLFHNQDFYDTNYHLRTQQVAENTARWLRDLIRQMEQDGL